MLSITTTNGKPLETFFVVPWDEYRIDEEMARQVREHLEHLFDIIKEKNHE